MASVKLKVDKADRVFFDGENVSDGHIAYRKQHGTLADKKLQTLVDTGQKFNRNAGELMLGDDAHMPDVEAVYKHNGNTVKCEISKHGYRLAADYNRRVSGWAVRIDSVIERDGETHIGDKEAYFDEKFLQIIEDMKYDTLMFEVEEKVSSKLYVLNDGQVIAVLMGIIIDR